MGALGPPAVWVIGTRLGESRLCMQSTRRSQEVRMRPSWRVSRSVTAAMRERYHEIMQSWLDWRAQAGDDSEAAEDIDRSLCEYMTLLWLEGSECYRGDYLFAALLCLRPEFNKVGAKNIPRSWRALQGWRRACPPRSRRPLAHPLCAASA